MILLFHLWPSFRGLALIGAIATFSASDLSRGGCVRKPESWWMVFPPRDIAGHSRGLLDRDRTPWEKKGPAFFPGGKRGSHGRGSWMIFMNRCWWLLKFIQFLRSLNLSSCVLTIATHYLPKAISEVTLILEGHDIWAPRPTKTRNSRPVITGFVKPTWERVPWNSHESTQVSAIFFKRILMRLEASSPLCALCGLFGGRICGGLDWSHDLPWGHVATFMVGRLIQGMNPYRPI